MHPQPRNRFEVVVMVGLAALLTIGFIGETLARWPDPIRLSQFPIMYDNPFSAVLHR